MTGDQVQNCPICFADFNQLDVLIEHAETCGSLPVINTSSNGPRCPVCAKKFLEYDSKYEMHVLSCVDLSCSVDASSPVKAIVSASSAVRAATDNPKLAKVIANRSLVPSKEILHSHNNSLNIPGGIAVLSGALRGEYPFASRKMPRQCPQYKRIHGTRFTMDAFRYGTIPECTAYFLSHFHSDHYGGLTKSFTGQIYTNAITAKLVIQQLGVNADLITILEMNVENVVGNAKVTLIDANQ